MKGGAALRAGYELLTQIWNPRYSADGLRALPWFIQQARAYRALAGAQPMQLANLYPQLHDHEATHEFDPHYLYLGAWAIRRILAAAPASHLDIGGNLDFVAALSASLPVTFLDYRPLAVVIPGLTCRAGSILALPFADASQASVSCLHVAEHIGLGRYGDPLDPAGTWKAAAELARVLAPGGTLYFALPIGRPRLCFNAHHIHAATEIRAYFADLELVEYSGVNDAAQFRGNLPLDALDLCAYGCGMFRFRRST